MVEFDRVALQCTALIVKTTEQKQKMRIAGQLAAQTLEMIGPHVTSGVTTAELDRICHRYIVDDLDAIPAPLNYRGFPKSICTSINEVVCHGIPSDERALQSGDIINIDVTVIKDGYHGDTSKMFMVGKVPAHAERLARITQECLYRAIECVNPQARLGDIGHAIQQHAESNHYSVVREFCGHGIGTEFHGKPEVMHYGTPDSGAQLSEGTCFTIEPMINMGTWRTRTLSDGWTAKTADGRLSAQWEHTLLVTASGCEVLTRRKEEHF